MGWGSALARVAGAAGVGVAQGKAKRAELDREELKEALVMQQRMKDTRRADKEFSLRETELKERAADRDLDRAERERAARERSADRQDGINARKVEDGHRRADRAESRAARKAAADKPPAEDYLEGVAMQAIEAANGDIPKAAGMVTQDPAGLEAYKRGLATRHFDSAARRYKERRLPNTGEADQEINGGAAAAAKTYSSDPQLRKAQQLWDSSPDLRIRAKHKRPQ